MSSGNTSKVLTSVPFQGGLDEGTASQHVAKGRLLQANNIRFMRTGKADKRPGNLRLATNIGGVDIDASKGGKIAPFRDEIVMIAAGANGARIGTYSPFESQMIDKGDAPEVGITRDPLTSTIYGQHSFDLAVGAGLTVTTWIDGTSAGDIFVSVVDTSNGSEIRSNYRLTATSIVDTVRVVFVPGGSVPNVFMIVFVDTNRATKAFRYVVSSNTFSGPITINSGAVTQSYYTWDIYATADRWYMGTPILTVSSSDITVNLFSYDTDVAATQLATGVSAATIAHSQEFPAFAICATAGEVVWVSYTLRLPSSSSSVDRVCTFNPTTCAEVLAAVTVQSYLDSALLGVKSSIIRYDATHAVVAWGHTTTSFTNRGADVRVWTVSTSGTKSTATRRTFWCTMASKLFMVGTKVYGWVYATGSTGLSSPKFRPYSLVLVDYVMDDLTTHTQLPSRPVAIDAPRFAYDDTAIAGSAVLPSVINVATNKYATVGNVLRSGSGRTSRYHLTADFNASGRYHSCELGDTLFFSGGLNTFWDGQQLAEVNFLYYPTTQVKSATQADAPGGGGSALTLLGTYWYRAVYVAVDGRGNVHRSAPSIPYSCTLISTHGAITSYIPNLSLTMRQPIINGGYSTPVGIELYRTLANPSTSDGLNATYFLVYSEASTTKNDPNSEFASILDLVPDTDLETNPELYTVGGRVDNVIPPASLAIMSHKGRLVMIADDRRTCYFSEQFVEGESPAFADEFTIPFDDGSQLTGLASMDGNWVIFSTNRIYFLPGEGPLDTTSQNDYGSPQRVASDLGCTEARSIVNVPGGVIFLSTAGRMSMLTRGLEVVNIGDRVQQSLSDFPVITSASVHPVYPWVMFSCLPSEGSSTGIRLIFDFLTQEWVRDTLTSDSVGVLSSCTRKGLYHNWMDALGNLWQEDSTIAPTTWTDNGQWVTATVELGFHEAGLQGYQRVSNVALLSERYSAHDLTLSVSFDYGVTYPQVQTWLNTTLSGITGPQQIEIEPIIQECEYIKIKFVDAAPTGAAIGMGQGAAFVDLTLGIEALTDSYPLPAAQRG